MGPTYALPADRDPCVDTRRWHQTARDCSPRRPLLEWLAVVGSVMWVALVGAWVAIRIAGG